jgi:hypothetical protein
MDDGPDGWRPHGCPIARDQPHGYKHFHTSHCRYASAEQITHDTSGRPMNRWVWAAWLLRWCSDHDSYHLIGHWPKDLRHG